MTTILRHEVDFVYFLDDGPCAAQQYVCKNGKCLDLTARCGGKNECLDDEQDCGTLRNNIFVFTFYQVCSFLRRRDYFTVTKHVRLRIQRSWIQTLSGVIMYVLLTKLRLRCLDIGRVSFYVFLDRNAVEAFIQPS